jgi:hypothetical protein
MCEKMGHTGKWSFEEDIGASEGMWRESRRGSRAMGEGWGMGCRGSTGFGKVHLHKGDKEWGVGSMQHDLSDVVAWALKEGITQPSKVAIMVRSPPSCLPRGPL